MEIREEENRFVIYDQEGQMKAELTWKERNNVYYVYHTFTDPSLRGQGIAGKLLDAMVEKTEAEQKMIMPSCPYVEKKFDEDPDAYQHIDVRKHR